MAKIYYKGRSKEHTLHVQPGVDFPLQSEWHEADGRPKSYQINFINNQADVEDNLARYLVDKGLASNKKIILPTEAA